MAMAVYVTSNTLNTQLWKLRYYAIIMRRRNAMLHVRSQCCLVMVNKGISYMFACHRIILIIRLIKQLILVASALHANASVLTRSAIPSRNARRRSRRCVNHWMKIKSCCSRMHVLFNADPTGLQYRSWFLAYYWKYFASQQHTVLK